eukprot:123148-Chlamydomonas_euryale.AAC.1
MAARSSRGSSAPARRGKSASPAASAAPLAWMCCLRDLARPPLTATPGLALARPGRPGLVQIGADRDAGGAHDAGGAGSCGGTAYGSGRPGGSAPRRSSVARAALSRPAVAERRPPRLQLHARIRSRLNWRAEEEGRGGRKQAASGRADVGLVDATALGSSVGSSVGNAVSRCQVRRDTTGDFGKGLGSTCCEWRRLGTRCALRRDQLPALRVGLQGKACAVKQACAARSYALGVRLQLEACAAKQACAARSYALG